MTNRPTPQTADVQKETQKKESQKITLRSERLGIEPATILFTTLFLVHCLAQAKTNFNTNEIREAS